MGVGCIYTKDDWILSVLKKKNYDPFILACMPGYSGVNCSIPCPYPLYGADCQGICNCIKDVCDVSAGCIRYNKGQYLIISDTLLKSNRAIYCLTLNNTNGFFLLRMYARLQWGELLLSVPLSFLRIILSKAL